MLRAWTHGSVLSRRVAPGAKLPVKMLSMKDTDGAPSLDLSRNVNATWHKDSITDRCACVHLREG